MPKGSMTFRIFISSTFSDLEEERNALQREVFPRLRKLCEENGCRFQAIDLRWGIRQEAGLDQRTMEICLEELDRCRKVTPRPNFLVLLGDRYGWMPLPYRIEAGEFEQIRDKVEDEGKRKLLIKWYARDDNSVPPACYLKARTGAFEEQEAWDEVEASLRSAILDAARSVDITPEERSKYITSATEQEIEGGALSIPDAGEHVFCFFREREDPPSDGSAGEFVDQDSESAKKLSELKERLEGKLGDNVHCYGASWSGEGPTLTHLDALCDDVYAELSGVISSQIDALVQQDELEREIEEHRLFAEERSEFFTGRLEMLERIAGYIDADVPHPLAVYGEGGSGKSALAAFAIQKAQKAHPKAQVIYRFIGATPSSSDVRELMESLCRQLTRAYGKDESGIPSEYEELVVKLRSRLTLATKEKPVIMFIDSLDQLSEAHDAASLNWLPDYLPANVRMVVTTRPGRELAALRSRLPEENVEKLGPMPTEEGGQLLDLWLEDAGRTLTDPQRQEVLSEFSNADGNPLYLKLAFEEATRWRSDTTEIDLSPNVNGIIRDLYARLSSDTNHGSTLVSRSLSYLATSREGLSEDELLDVLSEDEDVFSDFTERSQHEPPEKKLPVAIWSRLYYDIEPYLAERASDGTTLLTFYHRELGEVVHDEYLAGDEEEKAFHTRLADYFQTRPLGPRKVNELPWQLSQAGDWRRLYDLLSNLEFFSEAWEQNQYDVMSYWASVEGNSELNMVEAYRSVIETPELHKEHLWDIASLFQFTGHPSEALRLWEHQVERYRTEGNKDDLQRSLCNQANILIVQGELDGAMELYKESERICRELKEPDGWQSSLGNQALIFKARGNLDGAMELLKVQERICREIGRKDSLSASLHNQALILRDRGDLDDAMELLNEQERICREFGDKDGLSASLSAQASVLSTRGDLHGAMELLKEQERICRELGEPDGLQRSLGNQALILRDRGDLDGAMELLKVKERICRELGVLDGLQSSLGNQALILLQAQDDLDGAMELLKVQERICRELGKLDSLATSLANQAFVLNKKGLRSDAIPLAEEAHQLAINHGYTALAQKFKKILDSITGSAPVSNSSKSKRSRRRT